MENYPLKEIQEKILRMQEFLERFNSLDDLITQIKRIEDVSCLQKEFLTIQEVGKYLGISKSTVYKLIATKELAVYKPTKKSVYIRKEDVLNWITG